MVLYIWTSATSDVIVHHLGQHAKLPIIFSNQLTELPKSGWNIAQTNLDYQPTTTPFFMLGFVVIVVHHETH